MSIARGLKFILRSRGIARGIWRLGTIKKRFGFSPGKQIECIKRYAEVARERGAKVTFFIPAVILERYIKDIKKINSPEIEWGIHGYIHTDLSRLSLDEQEVQITRAVRIFQRCGIEFKGFRAPYLRTNDFTFKAIAKLNRFLYTSCSTVVWNEIYSEEQRHFIWMRNFYRPLLHSQVESLPVLKEGIPDIPVSLPDDDVLLDREKLDPKFISTLWRKLLQMCYVRNELFVLQLHPERIYELQEALAGLIEEASSQDPPFWITTLSEVAKWQKSKSGETQRWPLPYRGVFCITGDIDSMTINDFILRLQKWK